MRFDSSPRPRGAHIPQEIAVNVPSSRGEGRREKKKLVIVDNSEALDAIARDVAEENMTASKADLKGIKGFATKIWKHSLWHEYFRQKEIAKAKKDIEDSGSLYGAGREDAHKRAMDALINRFSSEYEESLHEGEERTKEKSDFKFHRWI